MGFYAPAQLVRDAREHGVEVRPVDINRSDWDCTLEPADNTTAWALRLGLNRVKGLAPEIAQKIVAARGVAYADPAALAYRAQLDRGTLEKLALADSFGSMGLDRRAALWAVKGLDPEILPLFAPLAGTMPREPAIILPEMGLGESVHEDDTALGLSLKSHPLALLRAELDEDGIVPAERLKHIPAGATVHVAGRVLVRQRPGSAKGVVFMTLEDETGIANIVVWPPIFERFRRVVMTGNMVEAQGKLQSVGEGENKVIHLIADRLVDRTAMMNQLAAGKAFSLASRDFH
jgi:error-prone DNA polymerase